MNKTVYTSKEKNYKFSSKIPFATKHSTPSNVYNMEFYRNFLFEYSLIGIVKPKFTRRNEIWWRIWEIEDLSKNVRKKQDRTSLNILQRLMKRSEKLRNAAVITSRYKCDKKVTHSSPSCTICRLKKSVDSKFKTMSIVPSSIGLV